MEGEKQAAAGPGRDNARNRSRDPGVVGGAPAPDQPGRRPPWLRGNRDGQGWDLSLLGLAAAAHPRQTGQAGAQEQHGGGLRDGLQRGIK